MNILKHFATSDMLQLSTHCHRGRTQDGCSRACAFTTIAHQCGNRTALARNSDEYHSAHSAEEIVGLLELVPVVSPFGGSRSLVTTQWGASGSGVEELLTRASRTTRVIARIQSNSGVQDNWGQDNKVKNTLYGPVRLRQ